MSSTKTTNPEPEMTWILWDGECGFCRRAVDWLLDQVKDPEKYKAMPFQTVPRPPMTDEMFEACSSAVHIVLPDGTIKKGGDACRYLLKNSKRSWTGTSLDIPPLSWLLEPGYSVVAKNRKLFSKIIFRTMRNKPPRNDVGDWQCCD